jgi:cation diffusion facilitator CzcD-associated flavoprotein CzcO
MATTETADATPVFDRDAVRAKYRAERDKRLRDEGNDQYIEMRGQFASYLEDPYVAPAERAPLHDTVDVAVIGGGFGGLLAGARLRQAGVEDLRIIEAGGDFGGTWYWNRYPGAACDTEAYIYLPLLEELGYMPKQKYASAPEILSHSTAIARHFRLYDNACLSTQVTELRWDDTERRWIISTNRGDRMRARFVIMSNGPLNRPKLPGIPGIETFAGHTFHTSRWDYEYTGGSSEGNLHKLADKRVGVIGTGATAVQCIPHLGESAQHLYVFQRTPSSVDVRNNRATDPDWAASLEPGWQRRRMENFNNLVSGRYEEVDLVNDGWTEIVRSLGMGARAKQRREQIADTSLEEADFRKMEQIRARVESVVEDPATAEALKPYYRQFCKRPTFNDYFLPTFNRPNVTLVDTDGKGVERVTERGVVVAGVEYEVDCLVFATGFEVGTAYTQRSGYEVVGRGGVTLSERWAEGALTLHGMHSRNFPNCLVFSGEQSGFTVNFPQAIDDRATHAAFILKYAMEHGVTMFETSEEAEEQWVEFVVHQARMAETYLENCTPGYYNNEGKPSARSRRNVSIDGMRFADTLAAWRAEGNLPGLELER